jgi:hypothetical protein
MATRQQLSINATAYVLSYAIIGDKMKVNNYEIIQKKTGVSDVDLIKKLMNKLKRYGITSKNYYIYHSCIEHEYSTFTISASIKSEYIELYCKSYTKPATYKIEHTVRAYTAQHALLMLNRNLHEVIQSKHYEYYTITNDELMHHE